jgi:response regulator NasT
LRPDALVIISELIDDCLLNEMQAITRYRPTPILVFTHDAHPDSIDSAVKAGATSYVIDCNETDRLGALIEVARVRFREQQQLKRQLMQTQNALKERKRIEKAKGIIMQTKRLTEDQAYNVIRKLAMNHNKRMGEIAEQIISASEVLV